MKFFISILRKNTYSIDRNKKNKNKIYDLYNNIVLNKLFIVINIKIVLSLLFINKVILLLIHVRSSVVLDN